jgi:hypothetical protein
MTETAGQMGKVVGAMITEDSEGESDMFKYSTKPTSFGLWTDLANYCEGRMASA